MGCSYQYIEKEYDSPLLASKNRKESASSLSSLAGNTSCMFQLINPTYTDLNHHHTREKKAVFAVFAPAILHVCRNRHNFNTYILVCL